MFTGSMVALVTPMTETGEIDFRALHDLVEWHIDQKTDVLVAAGTTGESATLTHDEKLAVIQAVIKTANKRVPVMAGTGTNDTRSSIQLTQAAESLGADAALIVTPYYNRPPQRGLYAHFKAIAGATSLPIILYNVPTRTSCDMLAETVLALAQQPTIVGIKEATGDIGRAQSIINAAPEHFSLYSGDDLTGLDVMIAGAKGIISVTANIVPKALHDMCAAVLNNDLNTAKAINERLTSLNHCIALETNPIPTKWLLHELGKIPAGIRLPLVPLANEHKEKLKRALAQAGVVPCKLDT